MKIVKVLRTTLLFVLPVAIVPAYAQKEHEEEKQPQQKQQQARPAQQQQHAQPQQQAKPAQQQQHAQQQQQAKPAHQQQRAQQQQQAKPAQQQQRAQQPQQAKPAQQQRANRAQPAASHGRIPDDRFRASFGRDHTFHVNRSDFVGGSRRFQYGGFWFTAVDPWPVGWLYTDNVYVDYLNGGYFLCDPVHPGVYISISIG